MADRYDPVRLPRTSAPTSTVVLDLVSQARYSPRAVLLKQAENAEALAGEIDRDRQYPEDWLVFRISGYAPDMPEPRLIAGSELLADLSSLVEHLTGLARLGESEPHAAGLDIADLMRRWGVTRKTLDRYRRSGLVARRVVDPRARGRVKLVFSLRAVEAFERLRPALVGNSERSTPAPHGVKPAADAATTPSRSRRLTAEQRSELLSLAASLQQERSMSLDACAVVLAREIGRSKSTVRRWLERGLPTGQSPGACTDRAALARRAQHAGIAMPRIASRLGLSVPAVHRLITISRAEALRRSLPSVPAAEAVALAMPEPQPILAQDAATVTIEDVLAADASEAAPMPSSAERAIAQAHAALMRQAWALIHTMDVSRPDAAAMDQAETAYRFALRLKRQLLRAAVPLIRRTIAQHIAAGGHSAMATDRSLLGRCLVAASDAIDAYVPKATGRLAARISLALARELAAKPAARRGGRVDTSRFGATPSHLAPPPWVLRGLTALTPRERGIIESRFGTAETPPRTLADLIAENPGLTGAAWWAIYRKAARATVLSR